MPPEALRPGTPAGLTGRSDTVDGRPLQERLRLLGGIARAWWVAKGRALAAARRAEAAPSDLTLSRPVIERAG